VFRNLVTHNFVLMWFRRSDPVFNTINDTMGPAYLFKPKCTIPMSTRDEWNKGPRPLPIFKGLVCYTYGSRPHWRARAGLFWRSWRWIDIHQFSRPRFALSWPVATKFKRTFTSEKYISISCDSEAPLHSSLGC